MTFVIYKTKPFPGDDVRIPVMKTDDWVEAELMLRMYQTRLDGEFDFEIKEIEE